MSLNINLWSKVGVDVQSALATAVVLTAITKASPAVASSVAHGYVDGDLLLLRISGMRQVDYRVVRVDNKTADTFELEGVDATGYDTFISGTAQKITFGTTAATLQDINGSGGDAEAILIKTIHDDQDFELPGNRSPLVFSFGSLWDPGDAALIALNAFDNSKTVCAIAFRFANGAKLYFAAFPSASLAPNGQAGGPVTSPVTLRVRSRLTFFAS